MTKAALVGLVSTAAVVALQSPATAAPTRVSVDGGGGYAAFAAADNRLTAFDSDPYDGYWVRARLWRNGEVVHTVTDESDPAHTEDDYFPGMPENTVFYLQACKFNPNTGGQSACSDKVRVVS